MASADRGDGFTQALAARGGPALVLGAAGSGRTELLVRRFLGLVDDGVAIERIAVLTQSAANQSELRARISGR